MPHCTQKTQIHRSLGWTVAFQVTISSVLMRCDNTTPTGLNLTIQIALSNEGSACQGVYEILARTAVGSLGRKCLVFRTKLDIIT